MKVLQRIPAWLRNKYVLTLIGFTIWMLFVDDRDFYVTYFKQRNELNALMISKQYYEQQNQHHPRRAGPAEGKRCHH